MLHGVAAGAEADGIEAAVGDTNLDHVPIDADEVDIAAPQRAHCCACAPLDTVINANRKSTVVSMYLQRMDRSPPMSAAGTRFARSMTAPMRRIKVTLDTILRSRRAPNRDAQMTANVGNSG